MTDEPQPRPRSGVLGRAWADLPLRAKGLVVVAIPLLALLLATVLFGVTLVAPRARARVLRALVANVRADRPPRTRVGLLDRNKEATDAWSASWRPWPTPSSACSPAARPRPAGPGPWPWARSA